MENLPLISVIVPVYRVEAYLDKCIASVVGQTYKNLEIILVDDGSPDHSGEICDRWAEKDARIRVIHQKNAGGGAARNAALDIARGEYVGMIDSDDYIDVHMYDHLYNLFTPETDIVECEIQETVQEDIHLDSGSKYEYRTYSTENAMRLHIEDKRFRQTPPNKLYRRAAIRDIRFPSGTGIDDEFWTYRVIGNARKLVHSSAKMYAYRQHSASVMHSLNCKSRLRAVEAKAERHRYIEEHFPNLTGLSLKNLWFTCIYQGQLALREMDGAKTREAMEYLRGVLRAHPCRSNHCSLKEKVWLTLAGISLNTACRLRNMLKIGL